MHDVIVDGAGFADVTAARDFRRNGLVGQNNRTLSFRWTLRFRPDYLTYCRTGSTMACHGNWPCLPIRT